MKLNSKELRVSEPKESELAQIKRRPLWIILDNVLDTYNIGGIFRLADAVAASEVILCKGSETPPSSRIHKSAVGTEKWVPWQHFDSAQVAITNLKSQITNLKVVAVEQDKRAVSLNTPSFPPLNTKNQKDSSLLTSFVVREGTPMAIIVGHETDGVSKEALDLADMIVEIPMWGVNKSLNVIVSAAIVVYGLM